MFCLQFAEPMAKNSKIPKLLLIPLLVWILLPMNFVKKVKKIPIMLFNSLVQLFVYIFGCFSTGKAVFDDFDDHTAKGGLKAMGEAMKRGIKYIFLKIIPKKIYNFFLKIYRHDLDF